MAEASQTTSPCSDTIQQPPWHEPPASSSAPSLCVFNTLTRTKVPFKAQPENGNRLRWYSCGPTVYDAAHLGHARNYVTFDILRRIMQDYFNYDILYIMNITDIDDKIIIRARQAHLLKEYGKEHVTVDEALLKELKGLLDAFALKRCNTGSLDADWHVAAKSKLAADDAKGIMYIDTAVKAQSALKEAKPGQESSKLLEAFQDILAPHLDDLKGATVNDPKVSRDLAAFWEADFLQDMRQLGVLPADVMTRVSEYIPEIIDYVQKIISNGFAYVTEEGSVYFDVAAFKDSEHHHYAKLCPWNAGNAKFFEEGEGALGMRLSGKRDPRDFALWKASKSGEPFWQSPWGNGRPGWHIECSAMAGAVAPGVLDIHSGGIDLAFPHHDNELAQAEAHSGCPQWVNYFLHAGHVHIEGHKMSKSLKNFVTIKECLQRYSARQMRIMFLQHQWSSPVTYKDSSMVNAVSCEAAIVNFFSNLSQHRKEYVEPENGDNNFQASEKALLAFAEETKDRVHVALCDSFDTPAAVTALLELVNKCNVYMKAKGRLANPNVLLYSARYIRKIFAVFGVLGLPDFDDSQELSSSSAAVDSKRLQGILESISQFRDAVRLIAKDQNGKPKDYFAASDSLRQNLSQLGVIFEDRPDGLCSLVKLVDPSIQDEEELAKKAAALSLKNQQAERAAAKAAKAQIAPADLFKGHPSYSKWDERGIPTHDASGEELSKSARKKVVKEYEQQVELHSKHN